MDLIVYGRGRVGYRDELLSVAGDRRPVLSAPAGGKRSGIYTSQ